jgi:hypothetical protein
LKSALKKPKHLHDRTSTGVKVSVIQEEKTNGHNVAAK